MTTLMLYLRTSRFDSECSLEIYESHVYKLLEVLPGTVARNISYALKHPDLGWVMADLEARELVKLTDEDLLDGGPWSKLPYEEE